MALFEPAFNYLMQSEDPGLTGAVTTDSGGVTRWGISQRAYPHLDIPRLTLEEAAGVYRNDYFIPLKGFEITSQRVASKLLDMAVNTGRETTVMLLQRALQIDVDGVFGPVTLATVNGTDETQLLTEIVNQAVSHYQAIAQVRHNEAKYLDGWLARARRLPPAPSSPISLP